MHHEKPITKELLERWALRYLSRFSSSEKNLRQILEKKIKKINKEQNNFQMKIDQTIEKMKSFGYINDQRYVMEKMNSLFRKGKSRSFIKTYLQNKGLNSEIIEENLQQLQQESCENLELQSALIFAKKRKIGCYRPEEDQKNFRKKDFEKLIRAGFSYDIAQEVLKNKSF